MSSADFSRVLTQLNTQDNITAIILTGGEPLVHPCFLSLLHQAFRSFSRRVVVTTNGTLDIPSVVKTLKPSFRDRLAIQISLDGTEHVNDLIRGLGSYRRVINNVMYLNEDGISPSIATTVSAKNYEDIVMLSEELKSLKFLRWSINLAAPMGRCDIDSTVSVEQWNLLVDKIKGLNLGYSVNIKKLYDMSFLDNLSDLDLRRAEKLFTDNHLRNCSSGSGKLYIYPNLNVYACTCLSALPIGNLKKNSIAQLLMSSRLKWISQCELRQDSPCRKCRYSFLCNGGCPGMSLSTFGEVGYGDIRCPRFRELAHEEGVLL
jgi:radical SAM protein with 4Fe4S-binding SPASM domain